ncbi:hypothetical protein [Haloferula sp. BvORR071]|uniref:hypothetical protein n=1 Tax=Haloferula sp. BvORR071 TaxID=1396141 RepID=UPI002240F325|nr:hypothetical protein [Haloferula sp. BvORR071]
MAEAPSPDQFNLRTGRILNPDSVVLLLEDPVIAEEQVPYTLIGIWKRGQEEWYRGSVQHDGISAAVIPPIADREKQLVIVGPSGKCTVMDSKAVTTDIIRKDYDFSAVACIEGSAVAVGINGSVNRMIDRAVWSDLSNPEVDEILEGICPYPPGGFLVCGWNGLVAHYQGKSVDRCETGSNAILTGITCDEDGLIHACGQRGTIIRGTKDALTRIDLPSVVEDFWSIVRYQGRIHVASNTALYRLKDDDSLELVKFEGEVIPTSFYHLDVFQDTHLLSVGMKDAALFDGTGWTRVL